MKYKITKSDLKGDIKDFPIEVVQKMVDEQVEQGNKADVEVFQKNADAGMDSGFCWSTTYDGYCFWDDVIRGRNFDLFFKKYPKKPKLVYIVGDTKKGKDIIKTLEEYVGINQHNYSGTCGDGVLYYIEPNNNIIELCNVKTNKMLYNVLLETYTAIKVDKFFLEVSMEEIAEKFGVDVSNLKIKA